MNITWLSDNLYKMCFLNISIYNPVYSNRKDSAVLFYLVAKLHTGKHCFYVLFIVRASLFLYATHHIQKMREIYLEETDDFYWMATSCPRKIASLSFIRNIYVGNIASRDFDPALLVC